MRTEERLMRRGATMLRILVACALSVTLANAQTTPDVRYVYDELGRLVAVIDADGQMAVYAYDAVGNVMSITRHGAGAVSIAAFTPSAGGVGTSVTIRGVGFSPTPSQNTVTFNGVAASVQSATPTELTVVVPPGATTGPIGVTTPTGAAASSSAYVVSGGGPVISSFTPLVLKRGELLTVAGSNFAPTIAGNQLAVNTLTAAALSASPGELTTLVPGGSGRVTVTTSAGSATSEHDVFVAPAAYSAGDVEVTARVNAGESRPVTLTHSSLIALVVFDAVVGQRIGFSVSGTTYVELYQPNGDLLTNLGFGSNRFHDFDPAAAGAYTLVVRSSAASGGTFTVAVSHIAADVTGTIAPDGTPRTISIPSPGQRARLTFTGTVGQRISLSVTSHTMTHSDASIIAPDGTIVAAPTRISFASGFVEPLLVTQSGTHTLLIDPVGNYVGGATLTMFDVAPDLSGAITVGGSPVTLTFTTPGQNGALTFSGSTGQRVSMTTTNATVNRTVTLRNPDGSTLTGVPLGSATLVYTLPATGVYTIFVNPSMASVGSVTFTLYDAEDVTATITPGGAPVTVTIPSPGQSARVTFPGVAGQRVSLRFSSVTVAPFSATILNPDGSTLVSVPTVTTSGAFIDPRVLGAAGVYTIRLHPYSAATGNVTLTLYDVPADVVSSITPGGAPVSVSTTIPGQNAQLTFTGTAGQRISLRATGVTISSSTIAVRHPNGTNLYVTPVAVTTSGGFIDTLTLTNSGTHSILVDPALHYTGSMTLTLYDVPSSTAGPIVPGGSAVTVTLSTPGQNADLTFSGVTGQRVLLRLTAVTIGSANVSILNPDGSALLAPWLVTTSGGIAERTLAATGAYTIRVDPVGSNTGAMTLTLYDVPPDLTGSMTVNGAGVPVAVGTPGQNATITFAGTASQQVTVRVASNTMGTVAVTLRRPDGVTMTTRSTSLASFTLTTQTLPTSGVYSVFVDPSGVNTGSLTLSVTSP
jgi:YD repeat-containing protein